MKDSIFVLQGPEQFFKSTAWHMAILGDFPEDSNYIDADLVHKAEMYQVFIEYELLVLFQKVSEVVHI